MPYEAVMMALLNLITKIVDGQPPDVKAELWRMYVEDVKAWRAFWGQFVNHPLANKPPAVTAPPVEFKKP